MSGDQPVFVQTVRPGGAADRAGVRENDVIVKVNGQNVTEASHSEVVELIQGRTFDLLLEITLDYYYDILDVFKGEF